MKKSTKKYLLYGAGAYVLLTSGVLAGSSVQDIKAERDWLLKEVRWRIKGQEELRRQAKEANPGWFPDGWDEEYFTKHPGARQSLPDNHRFFTTNILYP